MPTALEPLLVAPGSLTVLVVDDIQSSREELVQLVRSLGYQSMEASGGEAALSLIETQQPDIVLLDLLMPVMDGFEVAQAIRQRVAGRWLPVVILSSMEGDEFIDQALSTGAADYLIKPVKAGILRAKLRQYQRVLEMQAQLALLAQRHQAIHEHIVDAIVTTDHAGRIQEVNRAARLLLGLDDARLQQGVLVQDVTGLALQPLLEHSEVDITLPGGSSRAFAVSHKYWRIGSQEFCTLALHDLSEMRRVERMKDEFLATVSHELRTPLTSILGALGLMAAGAGGKLPDAAQELAMVAKRNGDRLSHLIDDVLDLTKLEGNRMPIHLRPLALLDLLNEAITANTAYARRAEVELQLDTPAPDCRVQVDAERFLQIMANLLSNAIKHSPKGKTVRVRVQRLTQQVQIEVIDQGPGIDPAFRKKLFEKFSQADGSDRRALGGTGLGLYIVRMLTERMGGTVGAESPAGGGSVFRLTLPRLLHQGERPRILCLAKDQHLRERLLDWLAELGAVDSVSSLAEAQTHIAAHGPPAALLASLQAQGPSDDFCGQLVKLVKPGGIALLGDAPGASLASRHGLRWLEQSAPRLSLLEGVQTLLSANPNPP